MMSSADEYVRAFAHTLGLLRSRSLPRADTLEVLRDALDISDDDAEAVIARGVALGILLDNGSEVRLR